MVSLKVKPIKEGWEIKNGKHTVGYIQKNGIIRLHGIFLESVEHTGSWYVLTACRIKKMSEE